MDKLSRETSIIARLWSFHYLIFIKTQGISNAKNETFVMPTASLFIY